MNDENAPLTQSIAKALIINHRDEALILTLGQHRAQPAQSFKPDLPGGIVDPGETERDGVIREILEETGITIPSTSPVLAYGKTAYSADQNTSITKFLYLIPLDHEPQVTLSWEHASYEWIPLNEVRERVDVRAFYNEAIAYCFDVHLLK